VSESSRNLRLDSPSIPSSFSFHFSVLLVLEFELTQFFKMSKKRNSNSCNSKKHNGHPQKSAGNPNQHKNTPTRTRTPPFMRLLPDKPAEEPTNEGASRSAKPIPGLAYLYDDDPKEEQKVTKQKRSKGKRTVRRVNYELLSQPEGLPALYDQFKSFKIDESLSVVPASHPLPLSTLICCFR